MKLKSKFNKRQKEIIIEAIQACINLSKGKKWFKERKCKFKKIFDKIENLSKGTVQVFLGTKKTEKRSCWIIFEGSSSEEPNNADWHHNFKFKLITKKIKTKIKVHTGLLQYYRMVKKGILKAVKEFDIVYIIGHSQGGGLATLGAENIKFHYPTKEIICVPISSLRVGNNHFVKAYNKKVLQSYRIWYGDDTVTRVPPYLFGYRHVNQGIHLKKNYWLPWNWLTFIFSWPLDHFPDLVLTAAKKQL